MRRLPSLRAIEAFDAAANLLNFTRAAEALCVTPGAVSRAIRQLEDELGVALFARQGGKVVLTAEGVVFQQAVGETLSQLAAAVENLRRQSRHSHVGITLLPSLAARWLAPQLAGFMNAHPEIELSISATREVQHLARSGLALAVRFGTGPWPGHTAEQLMNDWLLPVCRPDLLPAGPVSAESLLKFPLLHPVASEGWPDWFAAQDIACGDLPGPRFNDAGPLIQATLDGGGIALTRAALVVRDLTAGQLVIASPAALPVRHAYWLVRPENQTATPAINIVCDWLRQLARETAEKIDLIVLQGIARLDQGSSH